ncbi:MAG: hypothetical protein ABL869_08775 [Candidatus Nitrotoga sp.]
MDGYLFGTQPNAFLLLQQNLLQQGAYCLAAVDGEERNGAYGWRSSASGCSPISGAA